MKLLVYDSLTQAALESKGDVNKRFDIWKYFFDPKENNKTNISELFHQLCAQKLIVYDQQSNTFTVTRKGLYYVIKSTGLAPENFEMVPYDEAKRLSIQTLRLLCRLRYRETLNVPISEIKFKTYGQGVVNQIVDLLVDRKLIKVSDNTCTEIQITIQGIGVALRSILSI